MISLVNNSDNYLGAYARNILIFLGEYLYNEPFCKPQAPQAGLKVEEVFKQSFQKYSNNDLFKVYPNPVVNGYFVVEHNLNGYYGSLIIDVHDMHGKKCYSKEISENRSYTTIKTANFVKGIYIVSIKDNNKVIFSLKITII